MRSSDSAVAPEPYIRAEHLTPRELQVVIGWSNGLTRPEIARRLGISEHTVRTHTDHVLKKLGVHTRARAVALAIRAGTIR